MADRETGILTDRDEGRFASAVDELLTDDDRRAEMGARGRSRMMETFNWGKTGAEMEGMVRSAVSHYENEGGR